jgi:chemotaxis protein CheC
MKLSPEEADALGEVVNIGVGRAASSLSDLLETRIELKAPRIELLDAGSQNDIGMSVTQRFDGQVCGKAVLVFPPESGQHLARLMGGYDTDDEVPQIELSGILSEVGNIVLNGVLGSIANLLETHLDYSVPDFFVDQSISQLVTEGAAVAQRDPILVADTEFHVLSSDISGSIVLAFEVGLESLVEFLNNLVA